MNYFIRNRNAALSIYFEVNYFKGVRLYRIIPVERKVQRQSPFSPRLASTLWGEASGIQVKRGRRRPHGWQPPAQRWPPEQRRLDPRSTPLCAYTNFNLWRMGGGGFDRVIYRMVRARCRRRAQKEQTLIYDSPGSLMWTCTRRKKQEVWRRRRGGIRKKGIMKKTKEQSRIKRRACLL